jgi:hypothetical protein
MRVEIEASPPGPLRLIRSLPASRLAMLEGLNGIGKTLAIRLLQLCSGEMPYRTDSAAWKSLCAGLGAFSVTATELVGARSIRWEGDSDDWVHETPAEGPVSFRRLEVDGRVASLEEIRRLVRVYRLAGDEDLVETLAQRADHAADSVRRWTRRFADVEAGPLATLESRLGEVGELIGDWSTDRYDQLLASVANAEALRISRVAESELARVRRDELLAARRVQHELHQLESDLPTIQAEIHSVDSEIERLRTNRDATHDAITALAGQVAAAAPVAHELKNARRTLGRNRDNLASALDALGVAAAQAEVAPSDQTIAAAIRDVEAELASLAEAQASLDQAPAMRELLDVSTARLAEAEGDGLGDQVLIDDTETDLQLTVTETKGGMASRRAQLEGQPPPPEAAELAARLERVKRRHELLGVARSRAADAARYRRLVDQNQQRVNAALGAFDPSAVERLQELEAQRRSSDERMLELAAHRAALRQQLGGILAADTPEQAADQLALALEHLGLDASQLGGALSTAENDLSMSLSLQQGAEDAHRAARRELARAEAEMRRISGAVASSPELEWLRESLPSYAIAVPGDAANQQAAALGVAREVLDTVVDRLGDHRGQLAAVENGLRGLARRLRGHALETRRYVEELEAWLGRHFSDWFNILRVRSELLPEADGPVVVDLHTAEVRWSEGPMERARPLEAFSSGEQAFAYTRARLAILDEEEHPPPNRLIALDEFGAFIAHDRLTGLLAHLQDRAATHPSDQVLVILPLSRDYSSMAATAMGAEATRLAALAQEIDDRGYALQELVP